MSNQTPVTHRYYPRLSSVITQDDIPDILGFIKDGVTNLLDKIYYKDLQYSKGPKGDSAFYSLSIVSKRIDIEIPGTGIALVLNPDLKNNDSKISAFPITIEYQWKILAYLRYFSLGNFSFEPQQIFEVALRVLNVTEEQAIAHFVNTFVEPSDQDITPLVQFVNDMNAAYGGWSGNPIPVPTNATTITEVVQQIFSRAGKYASLAAFGAYLLTNDLQETGNNVKKFFKSLIPQDIDEFIKEVVIPKFKATLMLSAAIEFPRNILVPVYPLKHPTTPLDPIPEGNQDPLYPDKVLLSFGEALFYADTEKGFGYNMDLVLNTNTPAQIGNTGFVIDIHNLKIDLSKKENIAEADADGRPKEFMGVYMEYTEIFLPKKWFKKKNPEANTQQTIGISANHLLIGTGGLSGNISIKPTYAVKTEGNQTSVVDYFSKFFSLDYTNLKVKSMSNDTEVAVANKAKLLEYINTLPSPSQLKFVYPIGLTTSAGDYREFKKEEEYYKFISSLSVDSLDENNRTLWFDLGKDPDKAWQLGFSKFEIDFHQGKVVHSSLEAGLKIKKFKLYNSTADLIIKVKGEWESKENFKLSAAFLPFGLPLNLFDVLTFYLQNIEIGKKNDNFYIEADTKITFPDGTFGAELLKEGIDLPAVRYYANGKFEIAGGNSIIPLNLNLNLGPIVMSVTAIHFGTIQRERDGVMRSYNYIGFDGGINVNPLGLDVRGNGVKYYYTNDDDEHGGKGDSYFHISTLEVDLVIPGSASPASAMAIIKGALTIPEPGVSTEYRGKISVQLPKMNMYGAAEMAFDPKYPGFYIDASVDLPTAIPLGSFGIFGFRGLLGYRYIAHKEAIGMTDNDTWYDYYMHPQRGINMDKFIGPQYTQKYDFPFSVGLGASLATLDGRLASLRAMVLLSLPSMFAIDAGLTIISERLGLAETDPRVPPFYAFVIVGNNSLEIGAGGNFQLNRKDGSFIDIKAEVQMGFFFKNQRPWYVNFGTKEKPITAALFKDSVNIKAQAYLMIAAKGIEAGARVDFNLNLFIVKVWAAIEVGGKVSFERPQTGGYIYVEGGAEINLFIIKVSLFISIYFRVELVKPFLILAELKFELKVKIVFIKIKLKVHLTLKWEKNNETDTSGIPPITHQSDPPTIDYPKEARLDSAVKGVHMLTSEEFLLKPFLPINAMPAPNKVKDEGPYIPLDTYVDIKVEKGLIPTAAADHKIGGHTTGASGYLDLIPPEKNQPGGHVIRQVQHKYFIEDVIINIVNKNGAWEEYNPYRAVVSDNDLIHIPNINDFKIGYWQKTNEKYDTIRLLASTPFSFLDGGQPGWFIPEQYGITASSLFCTEHTETWHESNVLDKAVGTIYHQPLMYPAEYINGAYYSLLGTVTDNDYMSVSNISNPHNFAQSLKINNGNSLVVLLPQASAQVKLWLSTMASGVTVKYYKDVFSNAIYQQYELITEVVKTKAELADILLYNSQDFNGQYVSKIEIIPQNANQSQIDNINTMIDQIWTDAVANTTGEVSTVILSPDQQKEYDELLEKLQYLKNKGCTSSPCNELDFEVLEVQKDFGGIGGTGVVNLTDSTVVNSLNDYQYQYQLITGNDGPYVDFNLHSVLFLHLPYEDVENNKDIVKVSEGTSALNICFANDSIKDFTNKVMIIKINKTTNKPVKLKYNPDCGCEDKGCTKKDELCNFLAEITYNLNNCVSNSSDVLHDSWKCFDSMIYRIDEFDKMHPEYELRNGKEYILALIKELQEYAGQKGATLSYAMQIVQKIFNIMYELGDCGCNGNGNSGTVIDCHTMLQQVSWFTAQDYEYQQTIPGQLAVQQDTGLMMDAIENVVQPIWRPNSVYCVNLKLRDEVNGGDSSTTFNYYFGFKTAGPIGHFEKRNIEYLEEIKDENGASFNPVKRRKPEEYPITSLKSYIDMKKSYPNADGNLLMAKPVFYGNEECEIRLFFTKPYVYNMLKTWEGYSQLKELKGSVNIVIKDPVTDAIVPYPLPQDWTHETVPETIENWAPDDPNLPLGIQQMFNYINHANLPANGMNCHIELGNPVKPKSHSYSVVLTNLNPEKLYTAIVYNAFDENQDGVIAPQLSGTKIIYEENQKVHEFVFKTSRYKNFLEQIESYKLKEVDDNNVLVEERDAVYKIDVNLSQQQLDDAYTLVSGGTENSYLQGLVNTYSEVFDRTFEGVLGIKPLNPASTTEFVKIVNANKDVVAILVRNPEPFNDPKVPMADGKETFKILNASGGDDYSFKVLHSKDYSQMLVMNAGKKITNERIKCKFVHKSWNGTAYVPKSTVITNEIQLIK
ncbi:MAG: hypothetical protein MUW56_04035 [Chryseobacterium sp.]|uniref:hypothetical protein n=1 Tax=Chryseobacterium sp. TaxID=1871047 RepID=UPI0025C68F8E|nr:hypothetical protein [Chryseobacterium sp.]MCJ7932805.1 hypothetical protein [Chryseobacterium sp.]